MKGIGKHIGETPMGTRVPRLLGQPYYRGHLNNYNL